MLAERAFAHDDAGLAALCQTLLELTVGRVAIERPDGVLVERLLAAGLTVLRSIPTRSRPPGRASGAGGKSDRFDAFVLAELRAPTATASARCARRDDTRALRASPAPATISSPPAWRSANQLRAAARSRSGPAPPSLFADARLPDRAGLPGALPQPRRRPRPRPPAPASFPGPPRLLRPPDTRRLLDQAARRPDRPRRRARDRRAPRHRPRPGRRPAPPRRPDHPAHQPDRPTPSAPTPTARSSSALPRPQDRDLPPPPCSPRSATTATATPPRKPLADAGLAPSPSNPANARPPASAAPATNACATPSPPSPTPPATTTPGPTTSTTTPAPRPHHPRPSASSARLAARPLALLARPHPLHPNHHGPSHANSRAHLDTGRLMPRRPAAPGPRSRRSPRS